MSWTGVTIIVLSISVFAISLSVQGGRGSGVRPLLMILACYFASGSRWRTFTHQVAALSLFAVIGSAARYPLGEGIRTQFNISSDQPNMAAAAESYSFESDIVIRK